MRFYTQHHKYYCGIDLHTSTMYVCVIYARLVKPAHESAGKRVAGSNSKVGNAHLKWAFSEASMPATQY